MNYIVGIDKDKLKALILKIYNYNDKINCILNDAQLLVNDTNQYYKSEDGDYYRKRFNELLLNKKIVLENIKSYGDDLVKVINSFDKTKVKTVDIFRE